MTTIKKKNVQTICFWGITVSLIFVILFFTCLTVQSHSEQTDVRDQYYSEQAKDLTKRVSTFLTDKGFRNSGVAVTRQVDKDGTAKFTITVHHHLITALDQASKNDLLKEMESLSFQDEYCSFVYEFLQET